MTPESHLDAIAGCALATDGKALVSGSNDGQIRLWDAHSGQCIRLLHHLPQGAAAIDPRSGKLLHAQGSAWRYLVWQGHDEQGRPAAWPLEANPDVTVEPWIDSRPA